MGLLPIVFGPARGTRLIPPKLAMTQTPEGLNVVLTQTLQPGHQRGKFLGLWILRYGFT